MATKHPWMKLTVLDALPHPACGPLKAKGEEKVGPRG